MEIFDFVNVLVFIISLAKEILLLFLIYKGIKLLNLYIRKNNKDSDKKHYDELKHEEDQKNEKY